MRHITQATMLDNILVHEQNSAPPDNIVGRTKLDTRGRLCIFMGYSTQHVGDVYSMSSTAFQAVTVQMLM